MSDTPRADPRTPHPDRLDPQSPGYTAIIDAHDAAEGRGEFGYLDPFTGLFVMTAGFHLKRGTCCHNGCRHCPYTGAQEEGEQT